MLIVLQSDRGRCKEPTLSREVCGSLALSRSLSFFLQVLRARGSTSACALVGCAVATERTRPGWSWGERACAVTSSALPGPRCGSGCSTVVRAAEMFRKARRVNVRKRNDSEEEERERDEEQEPPPLLPPPGTGEEAGPGGGDRAPGGESLLGPGPPPPSALTPGLGAEAGGCFPSGAEPGNGLKTRKRPRENKEMPRASLLSFQDEEEGKVRASGALRRPHPRPRPQYPAPVFSGHPAP